jgi:hypothetical protein
MSRFTTSRLMLTLLCCVFVTSSVGCKSRLEAVQYVPRAVVDLIEMQVLPPVSTGAGDWRPQLESPKLWSNQQVSGVSSNVYPRRPPHLVYDVGWPIGREDSPQSTIDCRMFTPYPLIGDYAPDEYEVILSAQRGVLPFVQEGASLVRFDANGEWRIIESQTRIEQIRATPRSPGLLAFMELRARTRGR